MHTLFDFISSVNGIQYALALFFMIGFVIFCEILKPRPFEGLVRSAAEDIGFIRAGGKVKAARLIKAIILGPIYVLFYAAAVPLLFIHGIADLLGKVIVATTSFGWSPARAYFSSRRKSRKSSVQRTAE